MTSMVRPLFPKLSARIEQVLEQNAARVLLADDSAQFSGNEIRECVASLGATLDRCAPVGSRVGILLPNSASKGFAVLGLFMNGRVPVLLNAADNFADLERTLMGMKLSAIILDPVAASKLKLSLAIIGLDAEGEVAEFVEGPEGAVPEAPPADTALVLYTSGSSGEPKGVRLSEDAILFNADFLRARHELGPQSVATVLLPVCHTMALNTQFLPTFFAGGQSVFFDASFGLGRIYRSILESQGTYVALIAHMVRLCFEEKLRRGLGPALHVRQVVLAGGTIRAEHLEMARGLFPNAIIHKGYGLTEGIRVSMIDSRDPCFSADSAGYPLPGLTVQIRDDAGAPLACEKLGHIFVKGPNVMLGYDSSSLDNGVGPDGFLKTNDMGHLTKQGALVVHGRSDGIVKIYGKRVSLKKIEEAALAVLPALRDVRCITILSDRAEPALALFLELGDHAQERWNEVIAADFEGALRRELKNVYSVPKKVFVLEHLPRTSNGKIKNYALEEIWKGRAAGVAEPR